MEVHVSLSSMSQPSKLVKPKERGQTGLWKPQLESSQSDLLEAQTCHWCLKWGADWGTEPISR